jgi:hypothetical protein
VFGPERENAKYSNQTGFNFVQERPRLADSLLVVSTINF